MHSTWQAVLAETGAVIEHGRVLHYGHPMQEQKAGDAVMADLSHLGLIAIRGQDAHAFLQAQLTSDVAQVSATHSQLTAYLTPKGRALAVFRLFQRGEDYCLLLPRELVSPTLARLRMFVLRSKVILEDISDAVAIIGYSDPGDAETLAAKIGPLPPAPDMTTTRNNLTALCVPGSDACYQLLGDPVVLVDIWRTLRAQATLVGAPAWERLEILAGIPTVYAPTVEAFIPQMINLDMLGGVSFKKGCYPGQEIVARLRYLGQIKRRMVRLHCDCAEPPVPGAPLYDPAHESVQSVGNIVRAAPDPRGGADMLAVLEITSHAAPILHLGAADGPACALHPLPYTGQGN